jgi:hypothetical protein
VRRQALPKLSSQPNRVVWPWTARERACSARDLDEAERLELRAAADSAQAESANQTANDYMLAVVLFASSLFGEALYRLSGRTRSRIAQGS